MGFGFSKTTTTDSIDTTTTTDDDFVLLNDTNDNKLLVILDIDGTLIDRKFIKSKKNAKFIPNTIINNRYKLYLRPGATRFLDYLLTNPNIEVAVWANIVSWNLDEIVRFLFPLHSPTRSFSKLKFIWNSDRFQDNIRDLSNFDKSKTLIIDHRITTVNGENLFQIPRFRVEHKDDDQVLSMLQHTLQHTFEHTDNVDARVLVKNTPLK